MPTDQQQWWETKADPAKFSYAWLGRALWQKQKEIARSVRDNPLTAVKGCHASGKCVEESEIITLSEGRRVPASQLVGMVFDIPTLDIAGNVIHAQACAEWNRTESVYEVETESGRRIVRNAAHPLWTAKGNFPAGNRCKIQLRGWTPAKSISAGDLVAVAETLPVFGNQRMEENHLKMLGYLIGDGGYTVATTISFTQQHNAQLQEFKECARAIGCDVRPGKNPIEFRVTSLGTRNGKTGSNPALNFMRSLGIMKTHSRDKRIPGIVFELRREQIAVFLSRLYSTDGWACVGKHGVPEIGFASASHGLVRDVMDMLLRFGICARIEPKPKTHSWSLSISASHDVLVFCAAIGIFGKEDAVERVRVNAVRQQATKQRRVWRWKKALPGTRWERVQTIRKLAGKKRTVAIEVPFYDTFLTSFYEHNTYVASGLPLWWLTRYQQAVALNTAPTLRQVKLFWAEIDSARRTSRLPADFPACGKTSLMINSERRAEGASSSLGVNMQGYHSPNMLIICDEAPGIPPDIWDAIEGVRAGGNVRVLKLGNPVIPTGEFFDSFHRGKSINNCISISAFDTPNLRHETTGEALTIEDLMTMSEDRIAFTPFPSLITRAWVRERYKAWGPTHPKYLARVMAEFPTQADNAVFSLAWIEGAKREPTPQELEMARRLTIQVGVDVAGAGSDETVLVARVGGIILEMHAWADADPRGSVVRVLGRLRAHPLYRLGKVVVDTVGIGYNFALHLADQGFNVYGHKAGAQAMDQRQYANQKAEAAWQLRDAMRAKQISGLGIRYRENSDPEPEEETEAQLATMLYRETSRGITEIIGKEEMLKQHGVGSPDRAEALIMAFMKVVPAQEEFHADQPAYRISPV